MTAYLLTNHILNFLAPGACIAVLVVLLAQIFSRFLKQKVPVTQSILAQAAIIFIANTGILIVGLVLFKNDGKMATYAAMALGSALCQWLLWRGWTR